MKITNCPNCGAPLKGGKCEYCGTEIHHIDEDAIRKLELERQNALNQIEVQILMSKLCDCKMIPPYTGDSFL